MAGCYSEASVRCALEMAAFALNAKNRAINKLLVELESKGEGTEHDTQLGRAASRPADSSCQPAAQQEADLHTHIVKLQEDISQQAAGYHDQLAAHEAEVAVLQAAQAQREAAFQQQLAAGGAKIAASLAAQEQQAAAFQEQLAQREASMTYLQQAAAQQAATHASQLAELAAQLEELQAEKQQHEAALREQVAEREAETASVEAARLQQAAAFQRQLAEHEGSIEALQAEKAQQAATLQQQLSEQDAQIAALQADNEQLSQVMEALQNFIKPLAEPQGAQLGTMVAQCQPPDVCAWAALPASGPAGTHVLALAPYPMPGATHMPPAAAVLRPACRA